MEQNLYIEKMGDGKNSREEEEFEGSWGEK